MSFPVRLVTASCLLFSSFAAAQPALDWGPDMPSADYQRAVNGLLGRCPDFIATLNATPVPVEFSDEGRASNDPKKVASRAIWAALEDAAPAVGYCAQLTNASQAAARTAIVTYGTTLISRYVGGTNTDTTKDDDDPGNPINERHLIPMMMAWDQAWPSMTTAQRTAATTFMNQAATRVNTFMTSLNANDDRRRNNWMIDAFAVRFYAAKVTRNATTLATVRTAFAAFITTLFTAPAGFQQSTCSNLRAVVGYGSYDLQQRDAFTYHLKALQPVLELQLLDGALLSTAASNAVTAALGVARPYVEGTKSHPEFVCTTVAADMTNSMRGMPWVPTSAKVALRYARVAVPSTKTWLTAYVGDDYSAWLKVLVAGHGDEVRFPPLPDAGVPDSGVADAGALTDAGMTPDDAGITDPDAGEVADAGEEVDAGAEPTPDAGPMMTADAGGQTPDPMTGGCSTAPGVALGLAALLLAKRRRDR